MWIQLKKKNEVKNPKNIPSGQKIIIAPVNMYLNEDFFFLSKKSETQTIIG